MAALFSCVLAPGIGSLIMSKIHDLLPSQSLICASQACTGSSLLSAHT